MGEANQCLQKQDNYKKNRNNFNNILALSYITPNILFHSEMGHIIILMTILMVS